MSATRKNMLNMLKSYSRASLQGMKYGGLAGICVSWPFSAYTFGLLDKSEQTVHNMTLTLGTIGIAAIAPIAGAAIGGAGAVIHQASSQTGFTKYLQSKKKPLMFIGAGAAALQAAYWHGYHTKNDEPLWMKWYFKQEASKPKPKP